MARAVLTFHSIDDSGSVLSFPPSEFRRLVERLASTDTAVVTFEELLRRETGVTITFDDGMRTVHEHALPVLRSHGFPAHIFLATGYIGRDIGWDMQQGIARQPGIAPGHEMLDWSQVEDCMRGGLLMECHTVTHRDLRTLSSDDVLGECVGADDEIERRVGRRPRLMAFPFGRFSESVVRTLAPRYSACFTTRLAYLGRTQDLSRVPRLDTFYLRKPLWNDSLFSARTRGYMALRASIRAVRRKT